MSLKIFQEGEIFTANGEDEDFGCCKCSHIVQNDEHGFVCKVMGRERIFCEGCQTLENGNLVFGEGDQACKVALIKNKEHQHVKFQRKE